MSIRVLVVDDSAFLRRRLSAVLNADAAIEVVGTAANGVEAVAMAGTLRPDVITMDIEMPLLDGISATRQIMATTPTTVLMLSALTIAGAKATLDALEAGAVDYFPKRLEDLVHDTATSDLSLCARVRALAAPRAESLPRITAAKRDECHALQGVRVVVVAASTGGPLALQEILSALPASFPVPIVIAQHMPGLFTGTVATWLDQMCRLRVKEAEHGDSLMPGTAYLARGGMQTLLRKAGSGAELRLDQSDSGQIFRPCADLTFASAAEVFGKRVLGVVLTGMGSDGREGARLLKRSGATIWAQDPASSVVYGMPSAVAKAGLADRILSLKQVAPSLLEGFV